jgi:hypothetical protein
MPRLPHPPRLDNSNYTWRRVHIMLFSPPSRHSIHLRSKYSPQHRILKQPQSMFSLNVRAMFHTHIEPQASGVK